MKKLIYSIISIAFCVTFSSCTKDVADFNVADHTMYGEDSFYMLPMAFTPNNDNVNDTYRVYICSEFSHDDVITSFRLEVKQNGKKVFSTTHPDFAWNGNDPTGKELTGIAKIKLELGINGVKKTYQPLVYILRENCVPNSINHLLFGDMIDAKYGVKYTTQETFCP